MKKEIKKLEQQKDAREELERLRRKLDDWVLVASELEKTDKDTFFRIVEAVREDPDPEGSVEVLMRLYESGDKTAGKLIRKVVELCLEGIKKTLGQANIAFDSWDWESELVWSGAVRKVVDRLSGSSFATFHEGLRAVDVDKIADVFDLKKKIGVAVEHEIPPLVLARSDGTTLYTTRDIAYTLEKFEKADRIINVIGSAQKLAQLQLKLAMYALGRPEIAENMVHYSYELVELPGHRMSRRRAKYVTFDEIIEEATRIASLEVSKRSPELREEERLEIAEKVALGAVKYALLNVSSTKVITFTWDRVLNFEMNSAPFINYAYTRVCGILRKVGTLPSHVDYHLLSHPLERELAFQVARFPEVFVDAADNLKPDEIANYANMLAERFHEFYEKVNVIRAENEELKYARSRLVKAVQTVVRNAMGILGIEMSEKM